MKNEKDNYPGEKNNTGMWESFKELIKSYWRLLKLEIDKFKYDHSKK